MLDLERIRTRCREQLAQAEAEENEKMILRFRAIRQALQEDDCFSNRRKREKIRLAFIAWLDFPLQEKEEFLKKMEDAARRPGILLCPVGNGKTVQVNAILDPEIEDYYQFSNGIICKIREETSFYYLRDGKWICDGDLQRWFEDPQYCCESLRYQLL